MTKPVHLLLKEHPNKESVVTYCSGVLYRSGIIVTTYPMKLTCNKCITHWDWYERGKRDAEAQKRQLVFTKEEADKVLSELEVQK